MAPHPFVQKVAAAIKRHDMADPEHSLLIGLSGGADSVCLARVLDALGYRLGIAHVNHGLRGSDSDEDELFVGQLASRLRAPLFKMRVGPGQITGNLEASARAIRKRFLLETCEAQGFDRVALAHSQDDRTETFLLNLVRGTGSRGLVSMAPVVRPLIRPLIEVTRAEIEAWLGEIGQEWRNDATNLDPNFARNRIRHDVLPRLSGEFNPRLGETLARTVEILAAENAWMDEEARSWVAARFSLAARFSRDERHTLWGGPGAPRLDLDDLGSRPVGFVRRVLRAALEAAGSDLHDVGFDHLEQVRTLLGPGKSGRVIQLPGAIHVERSFDALVFHPGDPERVEYEYELPIPGRVRVAEAGLDIEARLLDPASPTSTGRTTVKTRDVAPKTGVDRVRVDGESIGPCVKIRNWKNGDTYDPAGLGKSKLKKLFQNRRIPRSTRWSCPVFVARSSIIWVASFPISRDFAPTERSRRIIEFEALPYSD